MAEQQPDPAPGLIECMFVDSMCVWLYSMEGRMQCRELEREHDEDGLNGPSHVLVLGTPPQQTVALALPVLVRWELEAGAAGAAGFWGVLGCRWVRDKTSAGRRRHTLAVLPSSSCPLRQDETRGTRGRGQRGVRRRPGALPWMSSRGRREDRFWVWVWVEVVCMAKGLPRAARGAKSRAGHCTLVRLRQLCEASRELTWGLVRAGKAAQGRYCRVRYVGIPKVAICRKW